MQGGSGALVALAIVIVFSIAILLASVFLAHLRVAEAGADIAPPSLPLAIPQFKIPIISTVLSLGARNSGMWPLTVPRRRLTPLTPELPDWIKGHFDDDAKLAAQRPLLSRECDLFSGKWVWDPERYPLWNPMTPILYSLFSCKIMGRKDSDYLKLRWQPNDCNVPRFDARDFLTRMRNRRIAFIGDSFAKNQWDSMVGMLTEGTQKGRVRQGGKELYSDRRAVFMAAVFEEFNTSVEFYVSRNLLLETRNKDTTLPAKVKSVLHVDRVDRVFDRLVEQLDIAVFNAGHWFHNHSLFGRGCFPALAGRVRLNMSVGEMYERGMRTWARWADARLPAIRAHFVFRTYEPPHGLSCPALHPAVPAPEWRQPFHYSAAKRIVAGMASRPVLLDISQLSQARNDAHIGRESRLNKTDCSHWCTPGVPDTWNELMVASLMQRKLPPFD